MPMINGFRNIFSLNELNSIAVNSKNDELNHKTFVVCVKCDFDFIY